MPPHHSRPFWGAALAASLVAAPALAALALSPAATPAQAAVDPVGTLTVGADDSGFSWTADGDAEAAETAALSLEEGTAGLTVAPNRDGDTEQPYPFALRGVTVHPVDAEGAIGDALDLSPTLRIDEELREVEALDRTDAAALLPRRLADAGLANSAGSAFDVDRAITTSWNFLIPTDAMSALPAATDATGGMVYCVAVSTGSVRTADNGTADGAGARAVLTFRDEDQTFEPAPEPTRTATPTADPSDEPTAEPSNGPAAVPPATETPGLRDGAQDDGDEDEVADLADAATQEPWSDRTFTAAPPTVGPDPDPTFTAAPPTVDPDPQPTFTAAPPTVQPTDDPEEPAASCADVDGAGAPEDTTAGSPVFTHGSTQDAITTQLDDEGLPYFQVPAAVANDPAAEAAVASALTGPGLDLGAATDSTRSLGFRLTAAPEDGAVTYRNHTAYGAFADRGHAQQRMLLEHDVPVEHRWAPTRDAHATWTFTERGVYCVAYAVDGPHVRAMDDSSEAQRALRPDDVLRFAVGDVDPTSVDCAEASEDTEIPFPADDGADDGNGNGDDDSDGNGSGDDDGNGLRDGSDEGDENGDGIGGRDDGDDERGGIGSDGDSAGGADGVDGRNDDEDDDENDEDETREVAAPDSAMFCPADGETPRQLRGGDYILGVTDGGMSLSAAQSQTPIANGSSVVVGDTARRTAAAGIDGFVDPGGQYLATGSAGAPGFTWTAEGFDDPVDLRLEQTAGDGQVRVFLGEGSGVDADGGTIPLSPDSGGTLLFGFDQPGEYAVRISDGEDREVELEFVAGDRYASAQTGVMLNTLLTTCEDVSWATDLLSAQAPPDSGEAQESDDQAQQSTGNQLGRGWWAVAAAGMTLAGLLLVAILVVVMRESRR